MIELLIPAGTPCITFIFERYSFFLELAERGLNKN
jgi:hypothetical protein